ncbi:PgsA Phosphatidylglycerophosphate synthase [Candidatus Nanopelagicaceae bacterium]|jgi:phosphatidylglycerophosphate synthase|uniref:Phosphatidylglycerophosphate synthase n=1 Tax=Candidatus Planktophila sulfonica TaxID=1884904 RepID=A0A249KGH4_9ACTN|nr:CDP-alcohol phosphatidyltransferase family protein [Candidatus Planktophila sulfonica]ASY15809.1 phosphatidylglycerophosphate synthase [Candidatus Planktophila sulfonica]
MKEQQFKERWSELHGGADTEGVVGGWLSFSYQAARVCVALRITPNLLTFLGLGTAIAMGLSEYAAIALLLLVISLFFDGIDGSVAILRGTESKWGELLDSLADRISEAFWLYMGWRLGIPAWVVITMWTIASTQEYARARLASLGHREIGVVTPTERPVRAIFMAFALIFYIFDIPGTVQLSYAFLALLTFSFLKVMKVASLKLR